ncbi:hypothetical protein CAPTEDRAFT_193267 [Capitella teleta]|uniref:Receptor ligand binding region domain-containing protein n=1 Tax=Capitella teleta TaxID=283909 RepID=R7VAB8_CAPTE|nr:hypothetical protein CAPTEDRAFT_193267 [Capitella teleta]|eukprot:ELU15763.1 hypothetical protein CAPTEDRAFT_193267 [Capitella teleta]
MANKVTFPSLIRTLPSDNKMGAAFAEIFYEYRWKTAVMLIQRGTCEDGALNIQEYLATINVTIAEYIPSAETLTSNMIDVHLARIRDRGRVVIMCLTAENSRQFIQAAKEEGMTHSDYVYFQYSTLPREELIHPWMDGDTDIDAYFAVKLVTIADMLGPDVQDFLHEVAKANTKNPWYIPNTQPTTYAVILHDATYIYLRLADEAIQAQQDPSDGAYIMEASKNREFKGATGPVIFDEIADRQPLYSLWHFAPGLSTFNVYARLQMTKTVGDENVYEEMITPYWGDGRSGPPPDVPACGLNGFNCPVDNTARDIALAVCMVVLVVFSLLAGAGVQVHRSRKYEDAIQLMMWKVKYEDIDFAKGRAGSMTNGSNDDDDSVMMQGDQTKAQQVAVFELHGHPGG